MPVTLDLFRNETEGQSYPAGHTIFSKGDPGDAMYIVLEGEVELHINGSVIETLGPGEPFGEMALIDRSPRMATVIAKTMCKLVAIPERRFLFMVQQTPFFSLQIMRVMAERLRKMDLRS
jgi:CRP/FNR family cyclic AMP-dependent transcriptional regulator